MIERDIERAKTLFPKMFRTFATYVIMTLLVFFGYVLIFGGPKINIIRIGEDDAGAEEENYFGDFVRNLTSLENIKGNDVNIVLKTADEKIDLSVQGDFCYDKATGLALDLDLAYNGQMFDVQATYLSPNLFLTVDGTTYLFDTSKVNVELPETEMEFDFSKVLNFVTQTLGIDVDKYIDSLGDLIGVDLRNFDPNEIMSVLQITTTANEETGDYNFRIQLGEHIDATIYCDNDFNITKVTMEKIHLENNFIQLDVPFISMNKEENTVTYERTNDEVDLTGLGIFVGYAQNTFQNNFVNIKLNVDGVEGAPYGADVNVDLENNIFKFSTEYQGMDVEAIYANENIYLNVFAKEGVDSGADGLKVKIHAKDFDTWKAKIEKLLLTQTGKDFKGFFEQWKQEFSSKHPELNLDEMTTQEILMKILAGFFENAESFDTYLPQSTRLEENRYLLGWNCGATLTFEAEKDEQEKENLKKIDFVYGDVKASAEFEIVGTGLSVEDAEFYELSNLLPVLDVVDGILAAKQLGGDISLTVEGQKISGNFVLNFENNIVARVELESDIFVQEIDGETQKQKVVIVLSGRDVAVTIGDIAIKGSLDAIEEYEARIITLLGIQKDVTESLPKNEEEKDTAHKISEVIKKVCDILQKFSLGEERDASNNLTALAVVKYLSTPQIFGKVSICDDGRICVSLGDASQGNGDLEIPEEKKYDLVLKFTSNSDEIQSSIDGEDLLEVLEKAQNMKEYFLAGQYAFRLDAQFDGFTVSAKVEIERPVTLVQNAEENLESATSGIKEVEEGKADGLTVVVGDIYIGKTDAAGLSGEGIEPNVNLTIRFQDGILFVDYGENKIKFVGTSADGILNKILEILEANFAEQLDAEQTVADADKGQDSEKPALSDQQKEQLKNKFVEVLTTLFGEDLTTKTLSELLNMLDVSLSGTTDDIIFDVDFKNVVEGVEKGISAKAQVVFEDQNIKNIQLALDDFKGLKINLDVLPFELTKDVKAEEYYDILAKQTGKLTLEYNYEVETIEEEQTKKVPEKLEIEADVEIDLCDQIYLRISTTVLGEEVEILINNNIVGVRVGEISLETDLNNAKELFDYVKELFALTIEGTEVLGGQGLKDVDIDKLFEKLETIDFAQMFEKLKNFDFTGNLFDFDGDGINNLTISGKEISFNFVEDISKMAEAEEQAPLKEEVAGKTALDKEKETKNFSVNLALSTQVEKEFEKVEHLANVKDLKGDLPKIKNLIDYFYRKAFEFKFGINYNGLDVSGTLKYLKGSETSKDELEIVLNNLFENGSVNKVEGGKDLVVRLHNDVMYVGYGNMKVQVPVEKKEGANTFENLKATLEKLLNDGYGVRLQLGVFEKFLKMLDTFSLKDYFNKTKIDINRSEYAIEGSKDGAKGDIFTIGIYEQFEVMKPTKLFDVEIKFDQNGQLKTANILVPEVVTVEGGTKEEPVVKATVEFMLVEESTIPAFDPTEFSTDNYKSNILDGLFDSLRYDDGVYAFSSDLAVRYGINDFYGDLTGLLVPYETVVDEKPVTKLRPALSLYTSSLGLDTFIYLIDDMLYIDIQGLQIKAPASIESINEILNFIKQELGIDVNSMLNKEKETTDHATGETTEETGEASAVEIVSTDTQTEAELQDTLSQDGSLDALAETFKALIPALDNIYAQWIKLEESIASGDGASVELMKDNNVCYGIQVEFKDRRAAKGETKEDILEYKKDSYFSDIILQLYIQDYIAENADSGMLIPTKLVLGANIHDPNTKAHDVAYYKDHLLKAENGTSDTIMEFDITKGLNFAVYLTNIQVGVDTQHTERFVGGTDELKQQEVAQTYQIATKDGGKTALQDFNDYHDVLQFAATAYSWATGFHYDLNLDGRIEGEKVNEDETITSTQTAIKGGIKVSVEQEEILTEEDETGKITEKTKGFSLDGKRLNVQGSDLDITQSEKSQNAQDWTQTMRHLINLFYSTDQDGLYITYSHDGPKNQNIAAGNKIRARINNVHMSDLISFIVGFIGLDLDPSLLKGWELQKSTTDFRFVQSLMGKTEVNADGTISKVDSILSEITAYTKLLKSIVFEKTEETEDGHNLKLTITVDMGYLDEMQETSGEAEEQEPKPHTEKIGKISLNVNMTKDGFENVGTEEAPIEKQKYKAQLNQILVENLEISGMTINFTVNVNEYILNGAEGVEGGAHYETGTRKVLDADGKPVQNEDGSEKTEEYEYIVGTDKNFTYDINQQHMVLGSLPQFLNIAIDTVNAKEFFYQGEINAKVILFSDIKIDVSLYAKIQEPQTPEEKTKYYVLAEITPHGSSTEFKGNANHLKSIVEVREKDSGDGMQISVNNYYTENEYYYEFPLVHTRDKYVYGSVTYGLDELSDINKLKDLIYAILMPSDFLKNTIEEVLSKITFPTPTIEKVITDFTSVEQDGKNVYTMQIDGNHLIGQNDPKTFGLQLIAGDKMKCEVTNQELVDKYNTGLDEKKKVKSYIREHEFIEEVKIDEANPFDIVGIIQLSMKLASISGDFTFTPITVNDVTLGADPNNKDVGRTVHSNHQYRLDYLNSIGTIIG